MKRKSIKPSQEIINLDIQSDNEYSVINGESSYKEDSEGNEDKIVFRRKVRRICLKVFLILSCLYMIFLIIGALSTDYYIDKDHKQQAVAADIGILKKRDDYKTLKSYVGQIRNIMTDITIVDIHVSNGDITYTQASNEYKIILDEQIDLLIPKVKTINVQSGQAHIKQEMQTILANDMGYYLQIMPEALLANNVSDVNKALQWKNSMLNTYGIISDEISALASDVKKDDDNFLKWELEAAVIEKDSTAVLKTETETSVNKPFDIGANEVDTGKMKEGEGDG